MRTRINEDFFDDNTIEDAAPEEPDYGGTGGTDFFTETVRFYRFDPHYIVRIIKRKLHFIKNNPAFRDLSIDRVRIYGTVAAGYAECFEENFPKSMLGTDIIMEIDEAENAKPSIYGDIEFRAALDFRSPKEIYDTVDMLVDSGNPNTETVVCQLICYPEDIGSGYIKRDKIVTCSINGTERARIWLTKKYGRLTGTAAEQFYYTYINDTAMLSRLKAYTEKKGHSAGWHAMLRIVDAE